MPIADQILHSLGMVAGLTRAPSSVADLGSGGGVPGLVLARLLWPKARWRLIESSTRRAAFLTDAVASLDLGDRVEVIPRRAEEAGRHPSWRGHHDLVLARSFGPPAVTAECAAALLTEKGCILVSEPPGDLDPHRWPAGGLAMLNLVIERFQPVPVHVMMLCPTGPCPDRYPRRVGIPAKRPLF
jgi:16S rRNA (guanine527-N7)-methyltransferase